MDREQLSTQVLIVGAGPSGLACAIRLKQLNPEVQIVVLEKGSEVGAHILSGAVMQPTAMNELFPNWQEIGAPLTTQVSEDRVYYFTSEKKGIKFPSILEPKTLKNHGNYVISLGNLCRWLAQQAEELGVEIYPGFAADKILFDEQNRVIGVQTGDMGVDVHGNPKDGYMPGMEILADYTVLSEGCRGHLGKHVIKHFNLDEGKDPQHYGLGIKELWQIDPEKHQAGLVLHTAGWPSEESGTGGGGFLYHLEDNQVSLGFISELSYDNPYYNPYEEMQRWKLHPVIKDFLKGGKRISYGARAIAKGGLQSLPKMSFPGGLLIGCDAGTLNNAKIKGSHTAMKSGMLAAESLQEALAKGNTLTDLLDYGEKIKGSWLYKELHAQRNWGPARHKFGNLIGSAVGWIDINIFNGKLPFTLKDPKPDYACLKPTTECTPIHYPKPDNEVTFSKLDSVFLSNTYHEEDQPCHLKLTDDSIPIAQNLVRFDEPAQRYCPAGVYEVIEDEHGEKQFQINGQNCLHCKTCDIKDPAQNITWTVPEGSGGPNYPNM